MIPGAFEYTRARTLAKALDAVARTNTKVMAGGQTLIPLMRFRLAQPTRVVDISGVPQLRGIRETPKGIRIGAATTYRELLDSSVIRRRLPLLAEVTEHVGDRQVRNVGTIGGGLAHADPASDTPAVMLALGASFSLRSRRASRSVPAAKFFLGALTTALRKSELLVDLTIPALPRGAGTAYVSFEQPASGYALVGAAAVVALTKGKVSHATLAYTGLAECAFLADVSGMVGTAGSSKTIARVVAALPGDVEANDDIHASAEYRVHLARVAAARALTAAVARAR